MNEIERAIITIKFLSLKSNINSPELMNHMDLAIESLEKQLNGGWILVGERLPNSTQRVLVTLQNGLVLEVIYINKKFKFNEIRIGGGMKEVYQNNCVVAWQPMPEKYVEVEDE